MTSKDLQKEYHQKIERMKQGGAWTEEKQRNLAYEYQKDILRIEEKETDYSALYKSLSKECLVED